MNPQAKKLRNLNFSIRMLQMLESSGKTQKELASSLGVSEGAIINWKRGQIPKGEELYALAQYFGVSMEWLLTGREAAQTQASDPWRERAMQAERRLSEAANELVALAKKISS